MTTVFPLILVVALASATPESAQIGDLVWLAGCWAATGGEAGSGEQWTWPAGGTMLGTSRTIRAGKTVAWEFLRIAQRADGGLDYISIPSGQNQTAFKLLRSAPQEVVFENPAHDFPQRIIYRVDGDQLQARIEGERDGSLKGVDFPMRRVPCDRPMQKKD